MTIQVDKRITSEMLTDGSNVSFPYDFPVFKGDNGEKGLEVRFVNDLGYDVVDVSLYSVISNSDNTGGLVQFYAAPTSGKSLVIAGNTPVDQQLDITNHSRFNGKAIETNFDKLIAIIQEWLSGLDEEKRQRIAGDKNVIDQANILFDDFKIWTETNVPIFVQNVFDVELEDFKQQWTDAMNLIASGIIPAASVIDRSGNNQQQVNDRVGDDWKPKSLGYEVHDRVRLLNGDIVKSTEPNNTDNPNTSVLNWRLTEIASSILATPESVNADPLGVQDVTNALNILANPEGRSIMFLTKGDFRTGTVTIPPNTICYMNGAKFIRKQYTGSPVIDVEENSIIIGAVVDGNKDAFGVGGAIADSGIRLQDGAIAIFCVSDNNRSHGITARGTDFSTPTGNQKALFCKASNNGFNAGPAGTADGFNAANSNNFLFFGCESYSNARTGFVAETYNTNIVGVDKHDITFSVGGKFKSCKADGNGYSDFNTEMVTSPSFDDITGNGASFRGSPFAKFSNSNLGQIYGEGADYAKVSNTQLNSSSRSSDVLFITGKSPKVSNVEVIIDPSVALTGTAVTIQDSTNYNGEVIGVSVNRANNGMNLRVATALGLRVDSVVGTKFFIGRPEGSANVSNLKQLFDKKLEVYSSGLPTQGAWNKNDIVWNTFFSATSKTMGWICTSSGVFGSATPPVFEAVTIMSRAVGLTSASTTSDIVAALKTAGIAL